jgi:hypothetical protein
VAGRVLQEELVLFELSDHAQNDYVLGVTCVAQKKLDRSQLELLLSVDRMSRFADRARTEEFVTQGSLINNAVSLQEELDFGARVSYCCSL